MKKILINFETWQTRIAILWNDKLQNIYFSSRANKNLERSFFKGIVTKVLPGIQTAFVDIGQEKAGFLHISEIDRDLAISRMQESVQLDEDEHDSNQQEAPRKTVRPKTDISKIFNEGDHILVQVAKEPMYEKGAKLSTCFTLPGRFIVLMPNIPRIGISKKIGNIEERKYLREFVRKHLPEGMGCIIRTTSEGKHEQGILKDIAYLVKIWNEVQEKFIASKPKECIYEDIDLPLQIVRDHLDESVEFVAIDDKQCSNRVASFVDDIAPEFASKIQLYTEKSNIFEHYQVEDQIEEALRHKVPLRSGGSLIIESAEAMTVIDVNTGRFIGKRNLEDTIFKTNLEAAEEIARQLRLRNIGGLIVIDFIDMATATNRKKLFQYFEKTLRERDKFQSVVLQLSEFGIVQMTRKRSGKTLAQELTDDCPRCAGLGAIKSVQTESYAVLRTVKNMLSKKKIDDKIGQTTELRVHPDIFEYIISGEYNAILEIEGMFATKLTLVSDQKLQLHECVL